MALISLKINMVNANSTKTMQFEPQTMVFDVCRMVREKNPEANKLHGQRKYYRPFMQFNTVADRAWALVSIEWCARKIL